MKMESISSCFFLLFFLMQAGCQIVCYINTVLGRLYRQENLNTKLLKTEDKIMGISPHTWHRAGEA
jgi:hypothetical protein